MYVRNNRRQRGFGSLTPPISGFPISSLFGPRVQPTAGASTNHQGIDFAAPIGTPVDAAGSGTVVFAGVQSGFGNTVMIDHGGGVTTLYGHLSSIGVSQGQSVSDGQQIALSGNAGTTSGPNLHFAVFDNGVAVDPQSQLGADIAETDWGNTDSLLPDFSADLSSLADATSVGADPVSVGLAVLAGGLLLYALA